MYCALLPPQWKAKSQFYLSVRCNPWSWKTSITPSGVASPKIFEGAKKFGVTKIFDFRRATAVCLGYRLSKHKTTRYAKNLRGHGTPGYVYMITPQTRTRVRNFSVWPIRSGRLGLAVSVKPFRSGPFRSWDISVTTFLYINNWLHCLLKWLYRQAKCHASWFYTNSLLRSHNCD